MKYIKTFESFKFDKSNKVDEGFLGNMFKKLKKGISMGISKKLGGAKKIDKAIEEYKSAITIIIDKKIKAESESLAKKVAQEKSDSQEAKSAYEQSKKASDKQIQLLDKQQDAKKNEFDNKMKSVVGDNENLQEYYNLAKVELASEMIAKELEAYEKLGGGDIDDPEWKKKFEEKQGKLAEFQKNAKSIGDALNKKLSEDKEVLTDVEVGGKFMYASVSAGEDITVKVIDLQEDKNKDVEEGDKIIKVETEKGTSIEVKKSQLKKKEGEEKEEEKKDEESSEEKTYEKGDKVKYLKNDESEGEGTVVSVKGDEVTINGGDTEFTKQKSEIVG